ncbi:uncharacterized protein L201_000181 [Kwoniella dendrophila CBS 6074]|uniref:Secreted protein n=1 Tax=Kwoniella dendrophila CBS 6074 TaxID=1295534 RepID=A0AAX4JIM7_9TREE
MFTRFLLTATSVLACLSVVITPVSAESHQVELINNCPVRGGVAWLDKFDDCLSSGVNCGIVEFTLTNPHCKAEQNAVNYSLLDGPDLGNHKYKYQMNIEYTGSCNKTAPAACTGNSEAECPGAYLGNATEGGAPLQCLSSNTGIKIIFC